MSHIRRMVDSSKTGLQISVSIDLIVNRPAHFLYFTALSTTDTKIMGSRRPIEVRRKIFVLRGKFKSKLALAILDLHLLLKR